MESVMKYHLNPRTEMIDFLLAVENCRDSVMLETYEGDMLNLKSQLSKYVSLATGHDPQYLESCIISRAKEDAALLADYLTVSEKIPLCRCLLLTALVLSGYPPAITQKKGTLPSFISLDRFLPPR